jgi:hypothetical protein
MRLSWHPESDVVVLSLWRGETCAGTFRMPHEDVGAFVDALVDGLRDAPGIHTPAAPPAAHTQPARPAHGAAVARSASAAPSARPSDPGDTQVIPAQQSRPGFTDWAFGPDGHDDRATAS